MKKHNLFFWILVLLPTFIYAQNVTIKGTIVDAATQETLVGASVVVSDTTQGTISDVEGKFSLENVPLNSKLIISFIGYTNSEYQVLNDDEVTINLARDNQSLDEYLVVGYGRQQKKYRPVLFRALMQRISKVLSRPMSPQSLKDNPRA